MLNRYLEAKWKQAVEVGQAIESFARSMRGPLPRRQVSSLGGRARARSGFRRADGTLMSTADAETLLDQISAEEYVRHAAGGRARASRARRAADGTFLPSAVARSASD